MKKQDKENLLLLLDKYYKELAKTCEYDCYNCELGMLEGHGYGYSCSIETVIRNIELELYP
jgi:hypothetical protein